MNVVCEEFHVVLEEFGVLCICCYFDCACVVFVVRWNECLSCQSVDAVYGNVVCFFDVVHDFVCCYGCVYVVDECICVYFSLWLFCLSDVCVVQFVAE